MIEVEKKFVLNEQDKARLTKDAEFLGEKVFTDIYYDTQDFSLTTNDKWLRCREGRFELKSSLYVGLERLAGQYDELTDEIKIREVLDLSTEGSFVDGLAKAGLFSFCSFQTTRKKYRKESFIIDLDTIDFQNFTYQIGEIELMVHEKSEIENAIKKIIVFAKERRLILAPIRGKVCEYLKRFRPSHYRALVQAKVVKDFD